MQQVAEELLAGAVDSVGCNEVELGDLYRALGGSEISPTLFASADFASAVRPALQLLAERADELRSKNENNGRPLTRIHFHTLVKKGFFV